MHIKCIYIKYTLRRQLTLHRLLTRWTKLDDSVAKNDQGNRWDIKEIFLVQFIIHYIGTFFRTR